MQYEHYLKSMFEPQSVAIIGASERPDSIGAVIVRNMLDAQFSGELHAINPKHKAVFGVPCVARIDDLRKRPDLVIICTPARTVPAVNSASAARPSFFARACMVRPSASSRSPARITSRVGVSGSKSGGNS